MKSGKWEVGSGKWEVGSGKWEVNCGTVAVATTFFTVMQRTLLRSPLVRGLSLSAKPPPSFPSHLLDPITPSTPPCLTISLLGPPNSGKSSLLRLLFPSSPYVSAVSPKSHTTREYISATLPLDLPGGAKIPLRVVDTPGLVYKDWYKNAADRRVLPKGVTTSQDQSKQVIFNSLDPQSSQGVYSDFRLVVLDSDRLIRHLLKDSVKEATLPKWCRDVLQYVRDTSPKNKQDYALVLNKVDLVKPKKLLLPLMSALVEGEKRRPEVFLVSCVEEDENESGVDVLKVALGKRGVWNATQGVAYDEHEDEDDYLSGFGDEGVGIWGLEMPDVDDGGGGGGGVDVGGGGGGGGGGGDVDGDFVLGGPDSDEFLKGIKDMPDELALEIASMSDEQDTKGDIFDDFSPLDDLSAMDDIADDESGYNADGTVSNPKTLIVQATKARVYNYLNKEIPYVATFDVIITQDRYVEIVILVDKKSQESIVRGAIAGKIFHLVKGDVNNISGGELVLTSMRAKKRGKNAA